MDSSDFLGKKVLITGGCGFLGSNLVRRLVKLGAEVSIFILPQEDKTRILDVGQEIEIIEGSLLDEKIIENAVKEKDFLFHFAWQTDLKKSMENPKQDLLNDGLGLIGVLEACRKQNKNIKIVFASTVTVTGNTNSMPSDEDEKINPLSVYDVHKLLAENYLTMYYSVYGLKTVSLRLSNVFGEGQRIDSPNRGVLNFMIGRTLRGEKLSVYGDGEFIRDYCYAENYIDAFLAAALSNKTEGNVYVLGSGQGKSFNEVVGKIKEIVEDLAKKEVIIEHVPFPQQDNAINKRNFIANYSKFKRDTEWQPKIGFDEGLKNTISFYYNKKSTEGGEKMKKKILVTGALGHIGSRLIRELAKGEDIDVIRILDNLSTQRYCSLFNLPQSVKYEFIEGDIRDDSVLDTAMKGIYLVIHLAAITDAPSTMSNPGITMEVNLEGTKKVIAAAKRAGVRKFIFPSTTSVYGRTEGLVDEEYSGCKPATPYAESKLQCEKEVLSAYEEDKFDTFVLRLGTIFGTSIGMRFHTAVNKFCYLAAMGKPLTVWDSAINQKRPYLGLGDTIRAMIFIEDNGIPGQLYNVVSYNHTVGQIVDTIKKFVKDVKIEITKAPIINQESYEVSNKKITSLGFVFSDDIEKSVQETLELFGAIKNT
ncbi:MAG: NAD-dependent epimerase/dehydratase [Nanoarchaeota archaeon]